MYQVFYLGGTVSVKLSERGSPVKIFLVIYVPTFNDEDE